MSKLNEYDKVCIQGQAIDALIEKIWLERSEVALIVKRYKKRKKK